MGYKLIMGKLMYYMTKVAPEIAKAIQELAGQIFIPTKGHWKALERAVSYVLHEPNKGLVLKKPANLKPYTYADSDYAADKDDQKSISGKISTLGGMIVGWCLKKQKIILLSSCESKYIAYGEACQEARFMNQLLEGLFGIPTSAVVYGWQQSRSIFPNQELQVSLQTKHIDICQHFVRELQRQKKVVSKFVQSENNLADRAMKNLLEKLFTMHTWKLNTGTNLISQREDVSRYDEAWDPDLIGWHFSWYLPNQIQ